MVGPREHCAYRLWPGPERERREREKSREREGKKKRERKRERELGGQRLLGEEKMKNDPKAVFGNGLVAPLSGHSLTHPCPSRQKGRFLQQTIPGRLEALPSWR